MIDQSASLEEVYNHAWGMMERGAADGKHVYHFPVLATVGKNGIEQRTLVLRDATSKQNELVCYSDFRSTKIAALKNDPQANWLFYDHKSKEQIRVHTQMSIHHEDERARELWNKIPPKSRGDYSGPFPPGTAKDEYTANLPGQFLNGTPTEENTAESFHNFCVLVADVQYIEWLGLRRGGHVRAAFKRKDNQWDKMWLAP
jgi:pyridoxamine 5'-phosphate oxidase